MELSGQDAMTPEPVLQEGGELTDSPLAELDQEVWSGFQEKFLENDR